MPHPPRSLILNKLAESSTVLFLLTYMPKTPLEDPEPRMAAHPSITAVHQLCCAVNNKGIPSVSHLRHFVL